MLGKPMKTGRIVLYVPAMPLRDRNLLQQASSAVLTWVELFRESKLPRNTKVKYTAMKYT